MGLWGFFLARFFEVSTYYGVALGIDAIGALVIGVSPRVVCGATEAAPFRVSVAEEKLAAGATEISVADARDMIAVHEPGFDDYDLQIHAVALSRAVGRAFA